MPQRTAADAQVHGDVDEGYGPVADVLARQLADPKEAGAAITVVRDGRPVVDLWGGTRDRAGAPYEADTMVPVVRDPNRINDRDLLRLELPAVGGVGSARGIARAYGELANDATTLGLRRETLEAFETPVPPPPGGTRDAVLRFDIVFSLGFVKPYPGFPLGSSERAYGMAGAGGSIGFADPDLGLGYGYTPNRMGFGNPTDPREVALREALYDAIGGPPQYRPGSRS